MSLEDRIKAIEPIGHTSSISRIHFNDAKLRSATLAAEADELMREMAASIGELQSWITDGGNEDTREGVPEMCGEARSVLAKYYNWKEKINER
jgi:hypothetical protein